MKVYKIVHKSGWLAACGLYGIDRAKKWLASFDARMYDDKTLKAEEFSIVEEK